MVLAWEGAVDTPSPAVFRGLPQQRLAGGVAEPRGGAGQTEGQVIRAGWSEDSLGGVWSES